MGEVFPAEGLLMPHSFVFVFGGGGGLVGRAVNTSIPVLSVCLLPNPWCSIPVWLLVLVYSVISGKHIGKCSDSRERNNFFFMNMADTSEIKY